MDAVSSVFTSCLALIEASDLVLRAEAEDVERFGGALGAPVLLRYCSILLASCSLRSRESRSALFENSSSLVISSWTRFKTLNRSTLRTTPANWALSRIGSAKFAPKVEANSSVAM